MLFVTVKFVVHEDGAKLRRKKCGKLGLYCRPIYLKSKMVLEPNEKLLYLCMQPQVLSTAIVPVYKMRLK